MFLRAASSGNTPEYWDSSWDHDGSLLSDPENDRVCENQGVVWRLLNKHLDRDRLFLEGGCGCANWVRYFTARGYKALGIDFASRTVERVKRVAPAADVRLGDVTAMPLPAGSVHSYYSGGVVEHFENGPEAALREARRVLADDGWFFCSVPDASSLRRRVIWPMQDLLGPGEAPPVERVGDTAVGPAPPQLQFYQYLFTTDEFTRRLEAAGFRVEGTACYALTWGLMEVPGLGQLVRTLSRPRPSARVVSGDVAPAPADGGRTPSGLKRQVRQLAERLLLKEDPSTPLAGPVLGLFLEHCANMRLYVARPAGHPNGPA